jgi:hypothetical protein
MFCAKCGTENPDNALFCKACGASLLIQERPKNDFSQSAAQAPAENVVTLLRKHASSSRFLAGAVCFAVAVLFQLLMTKTSGLLSVGINLVAAIGLFFIYNEGKKDGTAFSSTGFTLIKVATIISLAIAMIGIAVSIVSLVNTMNNDALKNKMLTSFITELEKLKEAGMLTGEDFNAILTMEYVDAILSAGIAVCVFCIAIVAIFYIPAIKTISTVSRMGITAKVTGKISTLLIVLMFISGGISVIALLGADIASGAQGIAYILFALTLRDFKRELATVKDNETHEL